MRSSSFWIYFPVLLTIVVDGDSWHWYQWPSCGGCRSWPYRNLAKMRKVKKVAKDLFLKKRSHLASPWALTIKPLHSWRHLGILFCLSFKLFLNYLSYLFGTMIGEIDIFDTLPSFPTRQCWSPFSTSTRYRCCQYSPGLWEFWFYYAFFITLAGRFSTKFLKTLDSLSYTEWVFAR